MKNYDDDNTFAKLLRDEIPSIRVYEDEYSIAFMDIMPQAVGHTLVIPRKASRNLIDAEPATLVKLVITIQKISKAVQKACFADGISIMQFNEAAAGQTIYHLHFHIIPNYARIPSYMNKTELEKVATKIRNALKDF